MKLYTSCFNYSISVTFLFLFHLNRNENFYGSDTVRVSTRNRNGVNNLDIPVIVEPINDPPFINAPEVIILKSNEDETLIYDEKSDKFEFSIGDPDLHGFPGTAKNLCFIFY